MPRIHITGKRHASQNAAASQGTSYKKSGKRKRGKTALEGGAAGYVSVNEDSGRRAVRGDGHMAEYVSDGQEGE